MTLSEFKAWFEGFSEGIDKAPTEKQFAKIKAKVALIDGAPITYPVFIDRYRHYYDRIWTVPYYGDPYVRYSTAGGAVSGTQTTLSVVSRNDGVGVANFETSHSYQSRGDEQISLAFDSHAAMHAVGRAEAAA